MDISALPAGVYILTGEFATGIATEVLTRL
jgi:hypothetical protein